MSESMRGFSPEDAEQLVPRDQGPEKKKKKGKEGTDEKEAHARAEMDRLSNLDGKMRADAVQKMNEGTAKQILRIFGVKGKKMAKADINELRSMVLESMGGHAAAAPLENVAAEDREVEAAVEREVAAEEPAAQEAAPEAEEPVAAAEPVKSVKREPARREERAAPREVRERPNAGILDIAGGYVGDVMGMQRDDDNNVDELRDAVLNLEPRQVTEFLKEIGVPPRTWERLPLDERRKMMFLKLHAQRDFKLDALEPKRRAEKDNLAIPEWHGLKVAEQFIGDVTSMSDEELRQAVDGLSEEDARKLLGTTVRNHDYPRGLIDWRVKDLVYQGLWNLKRDKALEPAPKPVKERNRKEAAVAPIIPEEATPVVAAAAAVEAAPAVAAPERPTMPVAAPDFAADETKPAVNAGVPESAAPATLSSTDSAPRSTPRSEPRTERTTESAAAPSTEREEALAVREPEQALEVAGPLTEVVPVVSGELEPMSQQESYAPNTERVTNNEAEPSSATAKARQAELAHADAVKEQAFEAHRRYEAAAKRLAELGVENVQDFMEKHDRTWNLHLLKMEMDNARTELVAAKAATAKIASEWRPKWLGGKSSYERADAANAEVTAEANYERFRSAYVGEKAYRKNIEATKLADELGAEMMEVKGFGSSFKEVCKKMGEWNLEKLGWKPEGRIGKAIAKGANVRTLAASLLVGGGAILGGGFMAVGMGLAGRGLRSAAAGFGAYDLASAWRERKQDEEAAEMISDDGAKGLSDDQLAERIAMLQSRTALGGRALNDNETYRILRRELSRRERSLIDNGSTDLAGGTKLMGAMMDAESANREAAAKREKLVKLGLKAGAAAFGLAVGSGVAARGFGALRNFFFGTGEVPAGGLHVAPAEASSATTPEASAPIETAAPAPEAASVTEASSAEAAPADVEFAPEEIKLSPDVEQRLSLAEVQKGDGYAKIIGRQLNADPARFGYDAATDGDQQSWVSKKVGEIIRKNHLVTNGAEMRLRFNPDEPSFVLVHDDLSLDQANVDKYSALTRPLDVTYGSETVVTEESGAGEWPKKVTLDSENPYAPRELDRANPFRELDPKNPYAAMQAEPSNADAMARAREALQGADRAIANAKAETALSEADSAMQEVSEMQLENGESVQIRSYLGSGEVKFNHDNYGRVTGVHFYFEGQNMQPEAILKENWPGTVMEHDKSGLNDWMVVDAAAQATRELIQARRVLKSLIDLGVTGKELDFLKDYIKVEEAGIEEMYGDILK